MTREQSREEHQDPAADWHYTLCARSKAVTAHYCDDDDGTFFKLDKTSKQRVLCLVPRATKVRWWCWGRIYEHLSEKKRRGGAEKRCKEWWKMHPLWLWWRKIDRAQLFITQELHFEEMLGTQCVWRGGGLLEPVLMSSIPILEIVVMLLNGKSSAPGLTMACSSCSKKGGHCKEFADSVICKKRWPPKYCSCSQSDHEWNNNDFASH